MHHTFSTKQIFHVQLLPIQVVEEFYSTKLHVREDIEMSLGFEGEMITLSIPRSGEILQSGWTIKPRYDPIVSLFAKCNECSVLVIVSYCK